MIGFKSLRERYLNRKIMMLREEALKLIELLVFKKAGIKETDLICLPELREFTVEEVREVVDELVEARRLIRFEYVLEEQPLLRRSFLLSKTTKVIRTET